MHRLVAWPIPRPAEFLAPFVRIGGAKWLQCIAFARGAVTGVDTAAIAVGTLLILLEYKINPALLVWAAAIIGALSF